METSVFIARIFGLYYLVVGIAFMFNREAFQRILEDFCKNAALLFLSAVLAFVIGAVIVLTHNVWTANWRVIITIIGWGAFIKGVWIIVFPNTVPRFMQAYQKNKSLALVNSIGALILGAVLAFFGFFAG